MSDKNDKDKKKELTPEQLEKIAGGAINVSSSSRHGSSSSRWPSSSRR